MSGSFTTPSIPVLTGISPLDAGIPFKWDFSNALAAGDTIASIVGVTALPAGLTVGTPAPVAGIGGAALAVQATLGNGTLGQTYTVTAEILSTAGEQIARSIIVPVVAR